MEEAPRLTMQSENLVGKGRRCELSHDVLIYTYASGAWLIQLVMHLSMPA